MQRLPDDLPAAGATLAAGVTGGFVCGVLYLAERRSSWQPSSAAPAWSATVSTSSPDTHQLH